MIKIGQRWQRLDGYNFVVEILSSDLENIEISYDNKCYYYSCKTKLLYRGNMDKKFSVDICGGFPNPIWWKLLPNQDKPI